MVGSSLEGHPARDAAYSRLAHAMFTRFFAVPAAAALAASLDAFLAGPWRKAT